VLDCPQPFCLPREIILMLAALELGVLPVTALLLGYLLGSIPFGLILTSLAGTEDLRSIGSGNIGATNVLRTGRKDLAALTLVLDALKGTLAVCLAAWFIGDFAAVCAGTGAFFGHLWPVWLKFKGGKGAATYLGVTLGLCWPAGLIFIAIWLAVAFVSRYSSLAALAASLATPIADWLLQEKLTQEKLLQPLALLALTILLWWRHAPNIRRLLDGKEGKIGKKG
jgi:glycerol-3-phosphate acyltransferase PlsY